MRQKALIVLTVLLVIGFLIAINAATYESPDERKDTEFSPNRSTYHAGPTGTRAFYDLLNESGKKVMRWREVPEKLLTDNRQTISTFVIIGDTPLTVEEDQATSLLLWVARGGRLVLVDRRPEVRLLPKSGDWLVTTEFGDLPGIDVDPANSANMTANVKAVQPLQPTPLTKDVAEVMPSKFAASISFAQVPKKAADENSGPFGDDDEDYGPVIINENDQPDRSPAPVVHLGDPRRPLLVDYPHGRGRIVILADPYILCNGGISLKDNLQLAINVVGANATAGNDGLIAFDEYHHGRGTTGNAFAGYFAGTPILALVGQVTLLILLILWTRSRRFARPVPLVQVDRRSALEFVASMAELQQRAGAYDLALENVYSRTRRVLARYAGTEYNSSRKEIAARVAERSSIDPRSLEVLMRQCEGAINGEPITERQAIHLVKKLREVETALGLRMRSRDLKQANQNI